MNTPQLSLIGRDAFISYSTKDSDFVTALRLAIELSGRQVWQDVKELELTEEWWTQIKTGIQSADNFLFVVSPRSMTSPICHLELEYAREMHKRLIIIHYEAADKDSCIRGMVERILSQNYLKTVTAGRDMFTVAENNWQTIEAEQTISITSKEEILTKTSRLVEAFDKDLLYIRQSNILLAHTREWLESDRNPSFLLTGKALASAELWRMSGKQPTPTVDQLTYIDASRQAENERLHIAVRQRRATLLLAVVGALAIIAAITFVVIARQASGEAAAARIEVANANATLTPIPVTLAAADTQVAQARIDQNEAQAGANAASTQIFFAGATATQIPPTLTQAAVIVDDARIQQEMANNLADSALYVAGDQGSSAIDEMNALVERFPQEAFAYLGRGLIQYSLGRFESAIADYSTAINIRPRYAMAYTNRAIAYHAAGDFEASLADFEQALAIDPEEASTYSARGMIYVEQQNYAAALDDYGRAIEISPDAAIVYYNRGLAYFQMGDFNAAVTDYTHAIELSSSFAPAYNNRGNTYVELGDFATAIDDFNQAIALDSDEAQFYGNRGLAYSDLEDYQAALADYTRAIALNPQYNDAYTNRGNAYYALWNLDAAIDDFTQAIALDPRQSIAYNSRAVAYYGQGNLSAALADFNQAIALDPAYARAYANRGVLYHFSQSQTALAVQDWQTAEQLGHELSQEMQQVIAEFRENPPLPTSTPFAPKTLLTGENRGEISVGGGALWTYPGRAGEVFAAHTVAEWDTTLTLRDPGGNIIRFNDDSGDLPNGNSEVALELPIDGVYTLEVRGFDNRTGGSYVLLVESGVSRVPASSEAVVGDNRGELREGESAVWTYQGRSGESLTIRTEAEWDTTLTLLDERGTQLAFNDDVVLLVNNASEIAIVLPADGKYTIEVGSYHSSTGGLYTLVIDSVVPQTSTPTPSP